MGRSDYKYAPGPLSPPHYWNIGCRLVGWPGTEARQTRAGRQEEDEGRETGGRTIIQVIRQLAQGYLSLGKAIYHLLCLFSPLKSSSSCLGCDGSTYHTIKDKDKVSITIIYRLPCCCLHYLFVSPFSTCNQTAPTLRIQQSKIYLIIKCDLIRILRVDPRTSTYKYLLVFLGT